MSALTAIINPLTSEKATKKVYLYWSHPTDHAIQYEQRVLGAGRSPAIGDSKKTAKLSNPSTLVSLVMDDTLRVYGVEDKTNQICLLVPLHDPIPGSFAKHGYIAGLTVPARTPEDQDEGYVYFQVTDTEHKTTSIKQQILSNTTKVATPTAASDIIKDSWLAALYDGKNRWVIYQKSTKVIYMLNTSSGANQEIPLESHNIIARAQAQIAAVYVAGPVEAGVPTGTFFVYFTDADHRLWRTSANRTNPSFSTPTPVSSAAGLKILSDAQITITADRATKRNFIYTTLEDGDNIISTLRDDWVYES
ncbi:hypothetical protein B0T17DRAFT_619208 [Bombardia bombarda]|uniref:Fucose-specific lectin n=1 Tax=Bombardia bombarda TaxID=252184 RepID=A0AA39WHN4_9PEZI|nr:hypothetical protein B0T17DRAFT_619208 [Bombardia bombarda]